MAFLTVVECQPHGLLGGLLLLNRSARPLEFHCTAPVRPNRVQELLYGPTLRPFLYGELIARTLIDKVATAPAVVLVDLPELLAARDHVSLPLALVGTPQAAAPEGCTPHAAPQAAASEGCAPHLVPQTLAPNGCTPHAGPQAAASNGCAPHAAPQATAPHGCAPHAAPQAAASQGCTPDAAPQATAADGCAPHVVPQAGSLQASTFPSSGSQPDVGTSLTLPGSGPMILQVLVMGRNRLSVPAADCQRVRDALAGVADYLDLAEPFDRIRSAIEEAQRVSRAA